jgi:drug/metabolite transporter (DMT)-like permease
MTVTVGIGLAFIAMLCWGFGDFLIQKSTRKLGNWETLFFMTAFGALVLLPFVWQSIPKLFTTGSSTSTIWVLLGASIILLCAALVDFEALRKGKLAIIEPIWSFEIPMAAFLAFFILGERISVLQIIFVIILLLSLILVAFREKHFNKKFLMEKGVILAILGAILMGGANFFMGWGGRVSDPLMVNFFTDVFLMLVTFLYLISKGKFTGLWKDLKHGYPVLLPMSIADKVAWVAFVFAMTLSPIAIATALSESYIIVAVLLGLFINKEKLQKHQKIGLVGAIISAVVLAVISS